MSPAKRALFSAFAFGITGLFVAGYMNVFAVVTTKKIATRPNIIYILTDDQDKSLLKHMPNTKKFIRDKGVSFTNYYDNTSLCCVARASILRGQYAHNTKVEDNVPPLGGFYKYHLEGNDTNNLPNWLQAAGYNTSFMGKHMNGYPDLPESNKYHGGGVGKLDIPSGWDYWASPVEGSPYSQKNYTLNVNGRLESHGSASKDYLTDVLSRKSARYIKGQSGSNKPFFMYVAPYGPHSPYTPPDRYKYILKDKTKKYPRTAAFNESDVSDKPTPISSAPLLSKAEINNIDDIYRKRIGSVKAIDDMVKNIIEALRDIGQLNNTYIVFSTDNGYHLGDHRIPVGKYTPYETDIRLDLLMRGPGLPKGVKSAAMAGNIDIAPTLVDMANGEYPSFVDGVSLLPWAKGTATYGQSRKYFLLERRVASFVGEPVDSKNGTLEPLDPPLPASRAGSGLQHAYIGGPFMGIRSRDGYTYVKFDDKQEEFYDMHTDRYQTNNLLAPGRTIQLTDTQTAKLAELRSVLPQLIKCSSSTTPCSELDGSSL